MAKGLFSDRTAVDWDVLYLYLKLQVSMAVLQAAQLVLHIHALCFYCLIS